MRRGGFAKYSVWRNADDSIVIIDGTVDECCKAMGVSRSTFLPMVSKCKAGLNRKWHIEVLYEGINKKPPRYKPKRVQDANVKRRKKASAAYREQNREHIREQEREWYSRNRELISEQRKKERARRNQYID